MTKISLSGLTRREALCFPLAASAVAAAAERHTSKEERRIPAPEAIQGVAADEGSLYAIGNSVIGKYDKKTGKRLAGWECENGKPLIHLDGGVVHGGVLICAHSNGSSRPPMMSSIEMWDTKTLRHTGSHSFGIFAGSATWVDLHQGFRYVTFAHYKTDPEPSTDPRWTTLIQFNSDWQQKQAWVYPETVISRLGQFSISGGVFTPDHKLFCTGHDNPEVYVLSFPTGGSSLVLEETFAIPMKGQGIALDPSDPGILYGIDRTKREIVVTRIRSI